MNHPEALAKDYRFFAAITLGWVFWLWTCLALALGNVFYTPLLWIASGTTLFGIVFFLRKSRFSFKDTSREFIAISLASITIAIAVLSFATPNVFSGRDQGSYAAAAAHLAQNHRLAFSTPASEAFFPIYGPGKALNFPGFDYTTDGKLTTQFPLGYIVWLASFFAIFGLSGFMVANAVTITLFLIGFFLLLRLFVSRFYALWGLLIAATSLPVIWFSKITLSENLALTLFVLLALHLILALRERSLLFAIAALSLAGFSAFTRIEGIFFLGITIGILIFSPGIRARWKPHHLPYIMAPITIFILLFIRSLFVNLPFYKAIAKAGIHRWQSMFESCLENDCAQDASVSLWSIFQSYGLIPAFLIGGVSIALFFKRRQSLAFIPFALAAPTLFYFFQPSISGDHPWMLRRFVFSLYPAFLFSAILGIALVQSFLSQRYPKSFLFTKRYYAGLLLTLLFLAQLPVAIQYAGFSENRTLPEQTAALAKKFTPNDLVLVDRLASGDGWSMLPEALGLSGIDAAYIFNPQDIDRLDTSSFEHTYLIVSENEASRYLDEKSGKPYDTVYTYTLDTERLAVPIDNALPEIIPSTTKGSVLRIK